MKCPGALLKKKKKCNPGYYGYQQPVNHVSINVPVTVMSLPGLPLSSLTLCVFGRSMVRVLFAVCASLYLLSGELIVHWFIVNGLVDWFC